MRFLDHFHALLLMHGLLQKINLHLLKCWNLRLCCHLLFLLVPAELAHLAEEKRLGPQWVPKLRKEVMAVKLLDDFAEFWLIHKL